jgi:hypothetical protein
MHIILAFLGTIITILVLLNRLADAGIDVGGLNPFLWYRRRKWRKTYEGEPIFKISNPMELAALLVVGLAKVDGDISTEEKHAILRTFEDEFKLSKSDASGLMSSSVYLLGRGDEFRDSLENIIKPSIEKFSDEQLQSTVEMLRQVAALGTTEVGIKTEMLNRIEALLARSKKPTGKWA